MRRCGRGEAAARSPGDGGTFVRAPDSQLVTGRACAARDGVATAGEVSFRHGSAAREEGVWLSGSGSVAYGDGAGALSPRLLTLLVGAGCPSS